MKWTLTALLLGSFVLAAAIPTAHADRITSPAPGKMPLDREHHFAKPAVDTLMRQGVIEEKAWNAFAPNTPITHAQFQQWLHQAFGVPSEITNGSAETLTRTEAATVFENVLPALNLPANGTWQMINPYNDIETLTAEQRLQIFSMFRLGIMKGDGQHHFYPNATLTRGEAAVALDRAIALVQAAPHANNQ